MALEGTYEYECMRAELLGVGKPDYEEFVKNKAEREAAAKAALEDEEIKQCDAQKEHFGRASGKLDELGNILKSTQRKINILTAPFSTYLKSKIGHSSAGTSKDTEADSEFTQIDLSQPNSDENQQESNVNNGPTKVRSNNVRDLTMEQVPLIDGLIEKTDKNMLSMEYQIKQMKRFK